MRVIQEIYTGQKFFFEKNGGQESTLIHGELYLQRRHENNDVAEDKARNEGPRRNANKMESQHIKIEVIKKWIA